MATQSQTLMPTDSLRHLFALDPEVVFLNHGSFGGCPVEILDRCEAVRREIERNPVEALQRHLDERMDRSRTALGELVGAEADELLLVPNATYAVNLLARSLRLNEGDEILGTGDEYGAVRYTWEQIGGKGGAVYRSAEVPRPADDPAELVEALWREVGPQTKLIVISHITSPTALRLPVEEVCRRARAEGILTLVDGAHAVGQIPLDLRSIQCDFYTSNCHKWLCSPRGTAFLYAAREHHEMLEPLVVSWGLRQQETFVMQNQWPGTIDFAPYWCLPESIAVHQSDEWISYRERCRELVNELEERLPQALNTEPISNGDRWIEQMVAARLPDHCDEALQRRLFDRHRIEIPVTNVVSESGTVEYFLRVSVQVYNDRSDIERLLSALAEET